MSKQCKGKVLDKSKSWPYDNIYRQCQVRISRGGGDFCHNHDPEQIAQREAAEEQNRIVRETVDNVRKIKVKEESVVGAFMRLKRPEEFKEILAEIHEAEKLADLLGGYR